MQDAQRGVSLAELVINLERLPRRRLSPGAGLSRRRDFPVCSGDVGDGQPRVSRGVVRVELNRSLEVFDAFLNTLFGPFVPKEVAFHIKLISLEVVCVTFRQ